MKTMFVCRVCIWLGTRVRTEARTNPRSIFSARFFRRDAVHVCKANWFTINRSFKASVLRIRRAKSAETFWSLRRRVRAKSLEEIEKEINAEIERAKTTEPTAEEIARALNADRIAIRFRSANRSRQSRLDEQPTRRFFGKADRFQKQFEEYRAVTPADVQRVAKQYLNDNRLVMNFVPRKGERPTGEVVGRSIGR